jgi:urate oxidase
LNVPKILFHQYGKTQVRLTQVVRHGSRHHLAELTVKILFEGAFDEAYDKADNSKVLPTDTLKNMVYVLAGQKAITSPEQFGLDLARHFLDRVSHLNRVKVEILRTPWAHIHHHDDAFVQTGSERRMAALSITRTEALVTAGIKGLEILKTGRSAFSGYLKDEFTTLAETRDRLFGTVLDANWTYKSDEVDFNDLFSRVRASLLETFASHGSESVQHTLYDMGAAALKTHAHLSEIHLVMPNKHRIPFDLARFGIDNPIQVFISTVEPSGHIEAKLSADD